MGAPHSGKSELASKLAEQWGYDVIDAYVPELEQEADLKLGHLSGYVGNLMVALDRYKIERDASDNYIICGTLVETLAYEAINAWVMSSTTDNQNHKAASDLRASTTIQMLGVLKNDIWSYDHVFYLPLSEEQKKADGAKWDVRVDDQIPGICEALTVDPIVLPTDLASRVEIVLNEIEKIEIAASVGHSSSGSGEEG